MSLSGPCAPYFPVLQSSSELPPPGPLPFSFIWFAFGLLSPGSGAGFFDEHPAIASITATPTTAIALANVERLFTQPPRPSWTGIITITLRQSGNNLPVADHQYIDSRIVAARRAEREIASVRRPAWILVGAVAIRHLHRIAAAGRDRKNVEAPVVAALIRELVALGRERRRRVVIAAVGDAFRRTTVKAHRVNLRRARPIRGECQRIAVRRKRGTHVDSRRVGELANLAAVARQQVQIGDSVALDRRDDPLAVGRQRAADHGSVRAFDSRLAPLLQVRQVQRRCHALVR